jgi:hypothetical protein
MSPRSSYVVSGRDLRIRPRNRPGPGEPPESDHADEMPAPEDPDYEDAAHPDIPEIPHVPSAPGLWLGPTKNNPVIPVPPPSEDDDAPHVKLPPGAVWPKAAGPVHGHYVALAYIPTHGWRYIVVDPDAWPSWEDPEAKPPAPTPGTPVNRPTRPT